MRALQITLFVLALLTLTTQTFRHVYVKWFEPRTSVLDKFNEPVENDITAAQSLDELVSLYGETHHQVKSEEKNAEAQPTTVDRRESWSDKIQREPYKSDAKLREAIQLWENHQNQIYELRFFFAGGLVSVLLGIICYRTVNPWLGMVGIIGGFSEMMWWTSPCFRIFGAHVEFDRLLAEKIIFSGLAWALLVGVWLIASACWNRAGMITD